jgi:putative ABC transport system permease protein
MQIWIAVLVAVLGIVNSLTITITDRRRELGILQAVGALRWQVRATIWMEAVCIALVGIVLGLALGAMHLYFTLEVSYRDYPGLRFDYMYPFGVALLLFPVILGAALVAALGPAESTVRGSLVEALEYE